jgi:hypothetical protein
MGAINSSDRIAATLYSLGTWFISGIRVNTLHKGDSIFTNNNNKLIKSEPIFSGPNTFVPVRTAPYWKEIKRKGKGTQGLKMIQSETFSHCLPTRIQVVF